MKKYKTFSVLKKYTTLITFIIVCYYSNYCLAIDEVSPELKLRAITNMTAMMISKQGYTKKELDDVISSKLFDEYFETLDPYRVFFSEKDIDQFRIYRLTLDDELKKGQSEFAFIVYEFFLKRLAEYQYFAKETLSKDFDFTKDESYEYKRDKVKRCEDIKELKVIWRKRLKYSMLLSKMAKKSKKLEKDTEKDEDEIKEEKKKKKSEKLWGEGNPKKDVLQNIKQVFDNYKDNEKIDILELYLSTLTKIFDPHSVYMSPKQEEDFNINMSLSLCGIGAMLTTDKGYTKITELIKGGPAERSGKLKAEDRIIAVAQGNKEPINIINMPLKKVVTYIRGEKNTVVKLTILDGDIGHGAIPEVISITRDEVKLEKQAAKGKIKEIEKNGKKIKLAIIELHSFYRDFASEAKGIENFRSSARDIKKELEKYKTKDLDGLILDMRTNGGGSLTEAVEVAGLFIKDGPVVQVRDAQEKIYKKYDKDTETYYDIPLLLLVNKFSASATEILAGAIKDYKRGIIVGDKHTHGKGTVQSVFTLQRMLKYLGMDFDAGMLKYTTAMFYRVNGSSTQLKGVVPDIILPAYSDVMEVGEKDLDNPLPWHSIDELEHDIYVSNLDSIKDTLLEKSLERRKDNNLFKALRQGIKIFKKNKEKTVVSLNEKVRWGNYLEEKKVFDEQKKLMNLNKDSSKDKKDKNKDKDLYLKEALNIMYDYLELLKKNNNE